MRPPSARVDAPIAWLQWSGGARARAIASDLPLLILVEARWSAACADLDRALGDYAAFATLVNARFVPVRLDAERRPDLAARVGFGEWPSVAFLTPGGELLGGGAASSATRLVELAERVDEAWRTRRDEIDAAIRELRRPKEPGEPVEPMEPLEAVEPRILAAWDDVNGGFGGAPKALQADAVRLLIDLAVERDDPALKLMAARALEAIAAGLVDPRDGGVYRRAERADWTGPAREKLLGINADALELFVHAGVALRSGRWLEQARDIAGFVRTWLADPAGGFAASVALEPPAIDAKLLTDANGRMISAMVRAGAALDDSGLTELAVASLERIVLATYRPGDGVGHVSDEPDVRGLLADQISLADALVDAHEATAREPYGMLAEELLHYCLRALWDDAAGGFLDRVTPAAAEGEPEARGVLAERFRPFVVNCAAARALQRVAAASGEPLFAERARETLDALATDDAARAPGPQGLDAAAYARARRQADLK